jgi:hypothetical protein
MRERKKPSLSLLDSTQQPAKVRVNDSDRGPDFVHGSERLWGQLIFRWIVYQPHHSSARCPPGG